MIIILCHAFVAVNVDRKWVLKLHDTIDPNLVVVARNNLGTAVFVFDGLVLFALVGVISCSQLWDCSSSQKLLPCAFFGTVTGSHRAYYYILYSY